MKPIRHDRLVFLRLRSAMWHLAAGGLCVALGLLFAVPAHAQDDPATAPVPEFEFDALVTPVALVVDLSFSTATGTLVVDVLSADWTTVPAAGQAGNPRQFVAQVLDQNLAVVREFNVWNPLWMSVEAIDGGEGLELAESAIVSITFPLAGTLGALRVFEMQHDEVTDQETADLVVAVDLQPVVAAFCTAHPDRPECAPGDPVNSPPAVDAGPDVSAEEGDEVSVSAAFADADAGDTHTATIDWGDGSPAEAAAIAAATATGVHRYADNGAYTVTVTVNDSAGNSAADSLSATIGNAAPLVDAGPDRTADAGAAVPFDADFVDPGTADSHTASIDWGDGSLPETAVVSETPFGPPGTADGVAGSVSASHVYSTGGVYTVTVTVVDDDGTAGSDTLVVTVVAAPVNQPPSADAAGPYLGAVSSPVPLDGRGSADPDGDLLAYAWSAPEGGGFDDPASATPSFAAAAAGIYPVALEVCDPAGACDVVETSVVVYDPSAGFVTGGGWIESPAGSCGPGAPEGACVNDVTGRANFGFVSRYRKGANLPDGQTEFVFQAGNLRFHSDAYQWLVVSGTDRAQFKGTGSINGVSGFEFMLTAFDGAGAGGPDGFRIKIWRGTLVAYDNRAGADDSMSQGNTLPISGGSIVIHTKK